MAQNPLVTELVEADGPALATNYRGNSLGNLSIEGAYLYPPAEPARSPA